MKTFEEFLREAIAKHGDVRLVPRVEQGNVIFYAHVNGKDSSTVDFWVMGDRLQPARLK